MCLQGAQDKKLLLHVKEFAGIVASNETGFAPAQSAEGSYPSGDQAEGQVADDTSWVNSITRIIQLDLNGETALAFTQAFAAGFAYDGLMGTLSMLWDTATWGWDAVWFAGTYVVGGSDAAFGTEFGQGIVAAGQSMEQSVYAAMEFGQTFYAVANDLPKLLGYASGALSNETQQVLDQVNVVLQELLPQILAELAELPQQEKAAILGQIAGMITYEITLTIGVSVATAGVGAAVSAAAAAGKFCKWAQKLNNILPERIAKPILDKIAKWFGCFEGPTNVTQYSVHGDLSQVTLAATVDLDVPAQERRLLSDGQWAAVGLGLVVALSCRALSRKAQADQEPEDDPWKVQYHYAA